MKQFSLLIFFYILLLLPITGACEETKGVYSDELWREGIIIIVKKKGGEENGCVENITMSPDSDLSVKRFGEVLNRLSHFEHPEKIHLDFQDLGVKFLSAFSDNQKVVNSFKSIVFDMSISHPLVNDKQIQGISDLCNIQYFGAASFKKMKITATSIEILAKSKKLKGLGLFNTNLVDQDFVSLKTLEKIETMNLSISKINGKLFSSVGNNTLKKLLLGDTNINDEGLVYFKKLSKLETLILTGCPIKGSGLKHLIVLKKLSSLGLTNTLIKGKSLVHLQKLPNLQELYLNKCDISDADIPVLITFKHLNYLAIEGTKITTKGVCILRKSLPKTSIAY